MRKICFLLLVTLTMQQSLSAQCSVGNYTVTGNTFITGSCIITGNLTILNGAALNVDLTSTAADTFVVRGNILLQGNAVLWIHASPGSPGELFIVSNNFSSQRNIISKDSSRMILENIELRTQEGDLSAKASIYMNYSAEDSSAFFINNCRLNREKAWLLCDVKNNSTLIGFETDGIPTELYLQDAGHVVLGGPHTETGIWLNFESITDTLTLPPDVSRPFSWKAGKGFGGLAAPWLLEINAARVGLGAQIFPTTKMVFNGSGLPVTGEFKISLLFANNTDTIKNLEAGLQNTTVANGPDGWVKLNNVNLGPIAWQLYALMNEKLFIKNAVVNEIGIAGPSTVVADSSLFQLAVLAAIGIGGSTMTINNSEIWSQSITAGNNSRIVLNNCNITGSLFSTTDALSRITVNGGCFFENLPGCTQHTMVTIATGKPNCNPFIPAGFPQNLSPAAVTFNGVNSNCTNTFTDSGILIFPNPSNHLIYVSIPANSQPYTVAIFSMLGQKLLYKPDTPVLDISGFNSGTYIVMVKQGDKTWSAKIVKL